MIAFYSTTLDGITYVASSYSYKRISADEEPSRKIRGFWALLLIFLPVGLLFAQNSLTGNNYSCFSYRNFTDYDCMGAYRL